MNIDDDSVPNRIFVGNLPPDVTDETLRDIFEKVIQAEPGSELISDSRVIFDPIYRRSKGFGFISFERNSDLLTALGQEIYYLDHKLNVQRATKRQTPPPPLHPSAHHHHQSYYNNNRYQPRHNGGNYHQGYRRSSLHNNPDRAMSPRYRERRHTQQAQSETDEHHGDEQNQASQNDEITGVFQNEEDLNPMNNVDHSEHLTNNQQEANNFVVSVEEEDGFYSSSVHSEYLNSHDGNKNSGNNQEDLASTCSKLVNNSNNITGDTLSIITTGTIVTSLSGSNLSSPRLESLGNIDRQQDNSTTTATTVNSVIRVESQQVQGEETQENQVSSVETTMSLPENQDDSGVNASTTSNNTTNHHGQKSVTFVRASSMQTNYDKQFQQIQQPTMTNSSSAIYYQNQTRFPPYIWHPFMTQFYKPISKQFSYQSPSNMTGSKPTTPTSQSPMSPGSSNKTSSSGASRINVSSSSAGTTNSTPGQLSSTSPPNTYNLVGSALNTLQTPNTTVSQSNKQTRAMKPQPPHNSAVAAAANFANHAASINSTAAVVLDGSANRVHQMQESHHHHQPTYEGHQHSQPIASMPIPIQQQNPAYYAQTGLQQQQASAYYACSPILTPLYIDPNPPMYRVGGPHSVGATAAECIMNPAISPQSTMAPHTFTSAQYYATQQDNQTGTYYSGQQSQSDAPQQHDIPDMARSPPDVTYQPIPQAQNQQYYIIAPYGTNQDGQMMRQPYYTYYNPSTATQIPMQIIPIAMPTGAATTQHQPQAQLSQSLPGTQMLANQMYSQNPVYPQPSQIPVGSYQHQQMPMISVPPAYAPPQTAGYQFYARPAQIVYPQPTSHQQQYQIAQHQLYYPATTALQMNLSPRGTRLHPQARFNAYQPRTHLNSSMNSRYGGNRRAKLATEEDDFHGASIACSPVDDELAHNYSHYSASTPHPNDMSNHQHY